MNIINQGFEMVPMANLKPHPRNANQGDFGAIQESIETNGFFGSIVANRRTSHILAGNHRYYVAKQNHAESIPVVWVDVDDEGELRILLADNRTTRLGHDDENALAALLSDLAMTETGLKGTGYDGDDLDEIIGRMAGANELLTDPDEIPEQVETRCKPGDIWQLGSHRLLCGDSTKREDVERLMAGEKVDMVFTDPPYGIAIVATNESVGGGEAYDIPFGGKKGSVGGAKPFGKSNPATADRSEGGGGIIPAGKYVPIIGDDTIDTAVASYELASSMFPKAVHIWWGGNYYAHKLPPSSCWIVWDKQNTGNFADAELAWTNQPTAVRIFQHMWNGLMKASERGEKRVHPTQKPVALAEWCIDKYGDDGKVMLDLFGGSGMSLVACEHKSWGWRGIEMSPQYCDIILARWEAATGQTAMLLEAGNGD